MMRTIATGSSRTAVNETRLAGVAQVAARSRDGLVLRNADVARDAVVTELTFAPNTTLLRAT